MIFLIPIGHEKDTVRRLPLVTFSILAICFIIHIFVSIQVRAASTLVEERAKELLNYYISHPYLEFDPEIKKQLFGGFEDERIDTLLSIYGQSASRPRGSVLEKEQEQFIQIGQSFISALNGFPYRKWGFIPADKSFLALITYMFVHGGWLHLLGNLLFLYMTGPFIEDLWGRPAFASFYVLVGMLSALLYAQHYPNFAGPLIGASGAIAGVMGAFLIKYWKIKINFFYFVFPFFRGTFQAPAWFMLPLWLGLEIFNARIMDSISAQGGSGVAHWAHVWGFVLGMAIAFGMNTFKIEEKYIHPKIEAKVQDGDDGFDVVNRAIRMKNLGMVNEAYILLLDEARNNPARTDVVETLWELGKEVGEIAATNGIFIKMIEREIRQDQLDKALNHYYEIKNRIPDVSIGPAYKFTLLKHLIEQNETERAKAMASEILQEIDGNSSVVILQDLAVAAKKLSPSIAEKAIKLCLKHPEIPAEIKDTLNQELVELNLEPV